MGNVNSLPQEYHEIVNNFRNLNESICNLKNIFSISSIKTDFYNLKENSKLFFDVYKQFIELNKFTNDQINTITKNFQNVNLVIYAFNKCINHLKDNSNSSQFVATKTKFQNDFTNYIHYLNQLIKTSTQLLQSILDQNSQLIFAKFFLNLQIFSISIKFQNDDFPPFYKMTFSEDYKYYIDIQTAKSQIINIASQHQSEINDISLIPLFLTNRFLTNSSQTKFIVVIEQKERLIDNIKTFYDGIFNTTEIKVLTSIEQLNEFSKETLIFPVISILTPFDALKFIQSVENIEKFVSMSSFIINESNIRTIETIIFIQKIKCHFLNSNELKMVNLCKEELTTEIKRHNYFDDKEILMKQLVKLRSIGIKLENEIKNLEFDFDFKIVNDCLIFLEKIGFLDNKESKNLTEIGNKSLKFLSVSPIFALATSKFKENQQFAFLCSLVIEQSVFLVQNGDSELFNKHFNRYSDVVTLLEALYEVSQEESIDHSFNCDGVISLYSQIEETFEGIKGNKIIFDAINWAHKQNGGIICMVDKFVSLLDKNEFIEKRKGKLDYFSVLNSDSESSLIYKMSDTFESKTKEIKMMCINRTGCIGLQSPINIIALNYDIEKGEKLKCPLIIHRNPEIYENFECVASIEVNHESVNNVFFASILEGYLNDRSIDKDFVPISLKQNSINKSLFLFAITKSNEKNYISFCPKNKETEKLINEAVPLLISLMPFVPRSIIGLIENPTCAIEITNFGSSIEYSKKIHLIDEPDLETSYAYPINKEILEFAAQNIKYLKLNLSPIRFAITGESFSYKLMNGKQYETDLIYPDVDPSINSVFSQFHASHLIILVDKEFENKPNHMPLFWLPRFEDKEKFEINDKERNDEIISVASNIMKQVGTVERSTDIFYVILGGGFPTIEKGEISSFIAHKIGLFDQNQKVISYGIHNLIHYFTKGFTYKQKLTEEIELKKLGSTNDWANYPGDENERKELCNIISKQIIEHFNLKENEASTEFVGKSMLLIRTNNTPIEFTTHKITENIWDNTYQPCKSDSIILSILQKIDKIDINVSHIVHVPTIKVCVQNKQTLGLEAVLFEQKVQKVVNKFGFLVSFISNYNLTCSNKSKCGLIEVELIGIQSGIPFAAMINDALQIEDENILYMKHSMKSCMGLARLNNSLISTGRINIIPLSVTEESLRNQMNHSVKDIDNDTTCMFLCEQQIPLPSPLYLYKKDGTVSPLSICKECEISLYESDENIKGILNPITHLIDLKKIPKIYNKLESFLFVGNDNEESGINEKWPQIALGQCVWALMSDPDIISEYVKNWFTISFYNVIMKSPNQFAICPNHPNGAQIVKNDKIVYKCPFCNMQFCKNCQNWHDINDKCTKNDDIMKKCPGCNMVCFKYSGFDGILCPNCNIYWCYACSPNSPIFTTPQEMYAHFLNNHQ